MLPQSLINAQNTIFDQMYIGNTLNRLRQLNQPTESDCKRWFWELLQNADDSKATEVSININQRTVDFIHNGNPFNADTLFGLLYKFSSKNQDDISSTGRFGTGFLTTHTISKIVDVESDYNDNGNILGFNVTIYREGFEKEELLNGVKLMRESLRFTNQPYNHTKFTYKINTQRGKNSVELGSNNILDNIVQTLLFLKHITKINYNYYGEVRSYEKVNSTTIKINESYQEKTKTFIVISTTGTSKILTDRFDVNRNLQLQIAIEYKNDELIEQNNNSCSYYCVLPLVGSEDLKLPFVINSPDFQPDSERESLYLNGTDLNESTGKPSDSAINKYILNESVKLFETLIDVINKQNFKNKQILLRGISKIPNFNKYFDKQFYEKYCTQLIDIIDRTPIVMCSDNIKRTTKEVMFCNKNTYPIYSKLGLNVPIEQESDLWNKYVKYNTEKDLINYIIMKNIKDPIILNMIYNNDKFIDYVRKHKIILNCNNNLITYDEAYDIRCVDDMILNVWFNLDQSIKNKCINKSVNIPILKRDNMKNNTYVSMDINETIRKLPFQTIVEKYSDIIYIVPNDKTYYEAKFIFKREMLSTWINKLFNIFPHEIIVNNNIDEVAFKYLDQILLQGIINFICSQNNIRTLNNVRIQDYDVLLKYISMECENYESLKCYPDLDGNFHKLTELYDCRNIPILFFEEQYHLRSKLLNTNISVTKKVLTITELQNILDNDNSIEEKYLLSLRTKNKIQQKMSEIYDPNNTIDVAWDMIFDEHNKKYLNKLNNINDLILDVMDHYKINYQNHMIEDIFGYERCIKNIYYYEGPIELYYLYNTSGNLGMSGIYTKFIINNQKYTKHKYFKILTINDLINELQMFNGLNCDSEMKIRLLKWLNENKDKYKNQIKNVYNKIPSILISLVTDDNIDEITNLLYSKLIKESNNEDKPKLIKEPDNKDKPKIIYGKFDFRQVKFDDDDFEFSDEEF